MIKSGLVLWLRILSLLMAAVIGIIIYFFIKFSRANSTHLELYGQVDNNRRAIETVWAIQTVNGVANGNVESPAE